MKRVGNKSELILLGIFVLLVALTVFLVIQPWQGEGSAVGINWDKVAYAQDMMFTWQIFYEGERMVITSIYMREAQTWELPPLRTIIADPFFADVVFVHSEEEAADFPDSTVVFWPLRLEGQDVAQGLVNGLNRVAVRDGIDLSEFGLAYPLTVENLVDDWEAVYAFIGGFEFNIWSWRGHVIEHGADAFLGRD
jgi:hypothetical protein